MPGSGNPIELHYRSSLDRALAFLEERGAISFIHDDFAGTTIKKQQDFGATVRRLAGTHTAFHTYLQISNRDNWMRSALRGVNYQLLIDRSNRNMPPPSETEWRPIPLDRSEPELQAAIAAVDDTVDHIRADNGYAAERAEERAYVMDGLTTFARWLKERASISLPYIQKYGVEPLLRAAKTLGRSAVGIVVEVAQARLKDWLMKVGLPWPFG